MSILYLSHWQNITLEDLNIQNLKAWKEIYYVKEARNLLNESKFDFFVVQIGFPNETIAELLELAKSKSLKTILLCRNEMSDDFKETQNLLGFDHLCNTHTLCETLGIS